MMTELRIDCPRCKIFVARVKSSEAEVETNCSRCRSAVVIKVADARLTVELVGKVKQQAT
jgi:hypothetical protein